MSSTVLSLFGLGVPPYSARGLTQSLTPIAQSVQPRRTVNGALRDVAATQFRKYASVVSGSDQQPPAVDGSWPGKIITVDCINELAVAAPDTEDPTTGRTAVSGSVRREGDFLFYRPRMVMMVVGFTMDADEWAAGVTWSLALEEV